MLDDAGESFYTTCTFFLHCQQMRQCASLCLSEEGKDPRDLTGGGWVVSHSCVSSW